MTFIRDVSADAAQGIGFSDTPEGLEAIHQATCAASIWHRRPVAQFQNWIDALAPAQLPQARVVLRPEAVRATALQICEASGTPDGPERTLLVDDIAALAQIFAALMGATWLRLRLAVVETNACRKFHVDALTARLVCTYRGTGTQYGIASDGAEPQQVFTVPTGAPIVLRGTLWPEHPRSGLMHRSPPIEGTGEIRSVLVLDPLADPDDAA